MCGACHTGAASWTTPCPLPPRFHVCIFKGFGLLEGKCNIIQVVVRSLMAYNLKTLCRLGRTARLPDDPRSGSSMYVHYTDTACALLILPSNLQSTRPACRVCRTLNLPLLHGRNLKVLKVLRGACDNTRCLCTANDLQFEGFAQLGRRM